MKKYLVFLLIFSLLICLAACGHETPPETTSPNIQSGTQNPQSGNTGTTGGTSLQTYLWDLQYDDTVWTHKEDELYSDETYCRTILEIPDGEDGYVVNVEIRVDLDDAENFRDYLESYGFDAYEYAVNNAYETVPVGGVACLKQEGNYWGDPCLRYLARVEGAQATVLLEIIGQYTDSRVQDLLNGLTFKLTDVGNVDFPWPWEGTPFSAQNHSVQMGGFTVNSQWIPIEDCITTDETFDHFVAAAGDTAYILGDNVLRQYAFDGSALVWQADLLEGEFDSLQADTSGRLWLSAFMEPLTCWADGGIVSTWEETDTVTMAPDGQWGINWFSGPECEKITVTESSYTSVPMNFDKVTTISHLMVDDTYIYVCGSHDDYEHRVHIYDQEGNWVTSLSDANGEGMGSITFVTKTPNGFLALDGNLREVNFWNTDGTWLGSVEDSELFGTSYPWFCGATKLADSSVLVVMTEDRADQSAMELVAFRLSGF